jgi:hypothetical protein
MSVSLLYVRLGLGLGLSLPSNYKKNVLKCSTHISFYIREGDESILIDMNVNVLVTSTLRRKYIVNFTLWLPSLGGKNRNDIYYRQN